MKFSILKLVRFAVILAATPAALATTWYVNGVNGKDNNNCKSPLTACKTIGHAISLASSDDSIIVAAAIYPENLAIGKSLSVIGSGAYTTIIDGGRVNAVVTVSSASSHVTISRVTIRNGFATNGGGVNNSGNLTINNSVVSGNVAHNNSTFARGGGVYNNATLTINSSIVSGNTADTDAGGIFNESALTINESTIEKNRTLGDGGGIWNLGTLTINDSTISGNAGGAILFSTGGGVANSATMIINNSTIARNTVIRYGFGGIVNLQGTLKISSSTISSNRGGIYLNLGMIALEDSIVGNNSGSNCAGNVSSDGYNLSSDNTCNFHGLGDLNNTNPLLGALGNNGGPTQTIPLLSASPAIDAGNPSGCTDGQGHLLKTDQRGRPRPDKEDKIGCDIGAFESQSD
jgi:hypothetical protein